MTTTETTESGPVHLGDPYATPAPSPAPGCDVCDALARQREECRRVRNMTGVSDCNVEIRQHPHIGRLL